MSTADRAAALGIAEQAAPVANVSARRLNPDTELPMPSPSAAQQQLADNLLARLYPAGHPVDPVERDAIREALVEVAVRQHGRTTRAHLDELRNAAAQFDDDARAMLADTATPDGHLSLDRLRAAQQLATAAATLRTTLLRGDRA